MTERKRVTIDTDNLLTSGVCSRLLGTFDVVQVWIAVRMDPGGEREEIELSEEWVGEVSKEGSLV